MCELVGYDIVNVSTWYCIVQLDDMKYNLGMRVLHNNKIIHYIWITLMRVIHV
jgi:hypothetical protein